MNKEEILKQIQDKLKSSIDQLKSDILDLKESLDNDTKSSAGDKFETSRAMTQQEMDSLEKQLIQQVRLWEISDQINKQDPGKEIGMGTIVTTSDMVFFLGIPLGKIEVNGKAVFCISFLSPIGKQIKDTGLEIKSLSINGKSHPITKIIT